MARVNQSGTRGLKHAAGTGVRMLWTLVLVWGDGAGVGAPAEGWDVPSIQRELREDFSTGLDAARWASWGWPKPEVVEGERQGRSGIWDNRGDGSWESGMHSAVLVETRGGFVLEGEFFLELTNPAGCWLGARMGVTSDPNLLPEVQTGQGSMRNAVEVSFGYDGDACWATPGKELRAGWIRANYDADAGEEGVRGAENYAMDATGLLNRWVRFRFEVDAERRMRFWVDGKLRWAPERRVAARTLGVQRVALWGRSRGSAGKAWVDWVEFRAWAGK